MEPHAAISQSLAGRTSILRLLPLSLIELEMAGIKKGIDEILYEGCYLRIHFDRLNPTKTYANYVRTYIFCKLPEMLIKRCFIQNKQIIEQKIIYLRLEVKIKRANNCLNLSFLES
jgi:hypothetical protein